MPPLRDRTHKIRTENIADDAVTAEKIPDGAITAEKLAEGVGGGGGVVLQRVSMQTGAVATGTTTIPMDDTIPQNTEGTEFMSLAITPTAADSILRVDVSFHGSLGVSTIWMIVALFRDAISNALAASPFYVVANNGFSVITFSHFVVAGATTATTFKVRSGGSAASTVTFNGVSGARFFGGVMASSMSITEYAAP